jgi:hypothetical protein
MSKPLTADERGFICGVAYAAAEMSRAFDNPTFAIHILDAAGIDAAELKRAGVDPYDARECRKVIKSEHRR